MSETLDVAYGNPVVSFSTGTIRHYCSRVIS